MNAAGDGGVPFGIWVGGDVRGVTIADLTIRDLYYHPIILNAGVHTPLIHNVRLVNAGQQFVKANPSSAGAGIDNGIVEYSTIEYDTTSRDDYTNGVDVHTGANWIVRHNLFRNIRAPQGLLAGPAVLMWSIVRNNFIYRAPGVGGDAAILVADSAGTQVLHNTALISKGYPNAIEYRFAGTSGVVIANNLLDGAVVARDGASGTASGNLTSAAAAMFVDPATGNLHLKSTATAAVDKVAAPPSNAIIDWDGEVRPAGATDVGADELAPLAPPSIPQGLRIVGRN
jgi:hypothetical protein